MDDRTIDIIKWTIGVVVALFGSFGTYLILLHKNNRKEQKENREERQQYFKEMNDGRKESDIVIRDTGSILAGLKSLLERDYFDKKVRK